MKTPRCIQTSFAGDERAKSLSRSRALGSAAPVRSALQRRNQLALGFVLAGLALALAAPAAESPPDRFHTDPACWTQPRIHQTGPPTAELRERVQLSWRNVPAFSSEGARSPNGAYRWWARNPSIND